MRVSILFICHRGVCSHLIVWTQRNKKKRKWYFCHNYETCYIKFLLQYNRFNFAFIFSIGSDLRKRYFFDLGFQDRFFCVALAFLNLILFCKQCWLVTQRFTTQVLGLKDCATTPRFEERLLFLAFRFP